MQKLIKWFFDFVGWPGLVRAAEKVNGSVPPMDSFMGGIEAMSAAFMAPVASWILAIPNIYIVRQSALNMVDGNIALSWLVAIALEMIGLILIGQWVQYRQWNETRKEGEPTADEKSAKARMTSYFALDIFMVVLLALQKAFQVPGRFNGWELMIILYPVIAIIVAGNTSARTTLYRLQRTRSMQKPATTMPDAAITKLEQMITDLADSITTDMAATSMQIAAITKKVELLSLPPADISDVRRILSCCRNGDMEHYQKLGLVGMLAKNNLSCQVGKKTRSAWEKLLQDA